LDESLQVRASRRRALGCFERAERAHRRILTPACTPSPWHDNLLMDLLREELQVNDLPVDGGGP